MQPKKQQQIVELRQASYFQNYSNPLLAVVSYFSSS